MLPFLQSQLQNQSASGIHDLCLDYSLVGELHPARFTEIEGLYLFPDLEVLSIAQQRLTHVKGLSQAPRLRVLDLNNNELQALDEICLLGHLEYLDVSHNEITDLEGIAQLGQLENLQIGFNQLQNLQPLADLPRLMTLVLNGNRAIRQLDGLPPSLLELHLAQCFVQDFSGLAALQSLRVLTLSPGSMNRLDLLSVLPLLEKLHIQAKRMHGILVIPQSRSLSHLRITGGQQISSLVTLAEFPMLETLQIHHSPMSQLPDLGHFPKLKHLEIKHSPLSNLDGIAELPSLETLNLEGSRVPKDDLQRLQAIRQHLQIDF